MTPALAVYLGVTRICAPFLARISGQRIPQERRCERLGIPTQPVKTGGVWVSAASLGELRAVVPLLADLTPGLVTTQTDTGADLCATLGLRHQYTPIDTPGAVQNFLSNWQPKAAIFVESEAPPRMIRALKARRIPTAVIAARASKTRSRLPRTMAQILGNCDVLTASSTAVAEELRGLGLRVDAVEDLKASAVHEASELPDDWLPLRSRPSWLAASTHPGDEARVLAAHQVLLDRHPDALLYLAPRHPQRFNDVAQTIDTPFTRQSLGEKPTNSAVHLVDTMGDLPLFHQLAPVSLMAGSFDTLGGHSPFEAARFGSHVVTGPDIANHRAAYAQVIHTKTTPETLASTVEHLWSVDKPAPFQPQKPEATARALAQMIHPMPGQ